MDPKDLPKTWPFRALGRSVAQGRHRWWVVDSGPKDAPALLLLHGTGASGHSFRRLIPHLSASYRVILPDLPGQGASVSRAYDRMGLDPMAEDLAALCDRLEVAPQAIIGHSAGAALALRLTEMRPQRALIGINAALGLFPGAAATLFPLMARALATAPFAARAAAALWGRPAAVQRLLAGTGSPLDAEGQAQYLMLVQDPDHVAGALAMMAAWRLEGLLARLPQITTETLLIAADGDRAVPPQVSRDAAARLPAATVLPVPGYGHMPQEEAPDGLACLILPWLNARLQPGAA